MIQHAEQLLSSQVFEFQRSIPAGHPDKTRVQEALTEFRGAAQTFLEVMHQVASRREAERIEQHDAVVLEGRAQLERMERFGEDIARQQGFVQRANDALSRAEADLMAVRNSEPRREQFPTRDEVNDWHRSLQAAELRYEQVTADLRLAEGVLGSLQMQLSEANATLRELHEREKSLRAPEERPSHDASTGLGYQTRVIGNTFSGVR